MLKLFRHLFVAKVGENGIIKGSYMQWLLESKISLPQHKLIIRNLLIYSITFNGITFKFSQYSPY